MDKAKPENPGGRTSAAEDIISDPGPEMRKGPVTGEGMFLKPLRPRLGEVARLLAAGLSDEQIAERTNIKPANVDSYVQAVLEGTKTSSRAEFITRYEEARNTILFVR